MARLIYVSPMSMDGFLGRDEYDWSNPGDEGLAFITEVMRPVGTYLYGRKMYETMKVWDSPDFLSGTPPSSQDFARMWQGAAKLVYSKSLDTVATKHTRLMKSFDPQAVRELKARSPHDISVGGSELAAQAIRAGLVDEIQLFVVPMMIGGGIPIFPDKVKLSLELLEERRFGDGWVYLRYRTREPSP